MSSFIIKIIAIITMLIDHLRKTFSLKYLSGYALGRVAFPLFAFQTTISYKKTKDLKKYIKRLFIFAIISQIPFELFLKKVLNVQDFTLNVMFTFLLGILCMYVYDLKVDKKLEEITKYAIYILKIMVIVAILLLAHYLNVDYGEYGVLLILFTYIFYTQKNKAVFIVGYIIITTVYYIVSYYKYMPLQYFIATLIGGFIPLGIMLLYNGKKGKGLKYLFYAFYPVHLIILVLIKVLVLK